MTTNADVKEVTCAGSRPISSGDVTGRHVGTASVELSVTIPEGATVEETTERVSGESAAYDVWGYETWYLACRSRILEIREREGADYLAAVCEHPEDEDPDTSFRFSSVLRVFRVARPVGP